MGSKEKSNFDPEVYSRTLAVEEARLREYSRRASEAKWQENLIWLHEGDRVNTAVALSNGVMSGLSLEEACAIALSVARTQLYKEQIQTTLTAITAARASSPDSQA